MRMRVGHTLAVAAILLLNYVRGEAEIAGIGSGRVGGGTGTGTGTGTGAGARTGTSTHPGVEDDTVLDNNNLDLASSNEVIDNRASPSVSGRTTQNKTRLTLTTSLSSSSRPSVVSAPAVGAALETAEKKFFVNVTGDFILGALFPIHRRGSGLSGSDVCDKIQIEDGIQPLEVLLHTLDKINENPKILPGIRLGVYALDSCDSSTYALEQSLDFIKGFIAHFNEHHVTEFQCTDGSPAKYLHGKFDRVVGVIGGQSSSVSIQVANLLRLFQVPQVSYYSTSPQLSNRDRFPYFFRTVPSDVNQAHAILDILQHFNWTYVAVIYSDSEYGVHCFETLKDVAANNTICFTTPQRVIRDQFTSTDYDHIIRTIANKPEIRVIVLILEKEYMMKVMASAKILGYGSKYVWIGTDAWSSRENSGQESIIEGAIAIQPLVSHVAGFDDYFKSLSLSHSRVNPWFEEFWEQNFNCKLNESSLTRFNEDFNQSCRPDLKIGSGGHEYAQQSFIHFVRDAVYAFAYALHNLHQNLCGDQEGICPAMEHIDGVQIIEHLKNVTFKDEDANLFRFVNVGDGPTRYTIVNYQRHPGNGTFYWAQVGNYSSQEDGRLELDLDSTKIRYRFEENGVFPVSTCATPCEPHQIKVREIDDTCCWKCRDCGLFQVKHDNFHCDDCKMGEAPDSTHTHCQQIPEKYIDYRNSWAIGAMGFAGLGILTTVFVAMVFWTYNETPIIKAAGRELSYILLLGIFLSFSVTFVIVAEPDQFTCGLMRFFMGFCPALCYAAIVTKTNRIARIFHHKPGSHAPKTKYTSPRSQMIIVFILTTVEVVINIVWIIWDPPRTTYIYPDRKTKIRICEGVDTYSYMVGVIYPLVLIGFCTLYAIQTRKCPGGFNETKYIAFTNYTIIIIWLAFVPLYLVSTSNSIRVVTLAISLSLSGFVELGCLFFPKIYIVLLKPEKNTKEVVMAPNRSSFATLSNSASHGIPNLTHCTYASNGNGLTHSRPHSSFTQSDNGIVISARSGSSSSEASC